MVTVLRRTCRYFRLRSCQTQVILCMSTRGPCQVCVNRSYWGTNDGWCHFSCLADWRLSSRLSFQIFLCLYIWTHTVTVRSALLAFSLYPRLAVYIYIEISAPLSVSLSLHLLPSPPVCLSLSISFSLTSVKCNWRSSLHMAHRHGGDIVCAVAANCSPCSSEPIPLLHFSPPPLFKPCPYSHYFISQPSLSPLSSPIPPILAVLLNYSIFFCGPSTGFKILALYGVIFLLVRIQRKVARRMSFSGSTFNLHT